MLVCLEETKLPIAHHWIVKMALTAVIMIGASVLAQAKFGPFATLSAITTDELRANTLTDYYRDPAASIVLVGSSLTYRLTQQYFNLEDVRNIALPGSSTLTGMRIVASQSSLPRILLVETNVLVWPPNEELIAQFSRSVLNVAPLRIRPIRTLIASRYGRTVDSLYRMYRARMPAVLNQPPADPRPPDPWLTSSYTLPEELMRQNARGIVELALSLETRGTKVILFQIPAPRRIVDSEQMNLTNRFLREAGSKRVLEMELPADESKLRWSDGAHLDERSSILVIRSIESWLSERVLLN